MNKMPEKYKMWVEARKKFHLSHAHIQMAKELGMNPKKFGSLANHKQEPWKAPLSMFIEDLYFKRFKKMKPDLVISIEDKIKLSNKKKSEKKSQNAGILGIGK